jgi:hypothetical protein
MIRDPKPADRPIVKGPQQPGSLKGTMPSMPPEFDAPLDDFKEYVRGSADIIPPD